MVYFFYNKAHTLIVKLIYFQHTVHSFTITPPKCFTQLQLQLHHTHFNYNYNYSFIFTYIIPLFLEIFAARRFGLFFIFCLLFSQTLTASFLLFLFFFFKITVQNLNNLKQISGSDVVGDPLTQLKIIK